MRMYIYTHYKQQYGIQLCYNTIYVYVCVCVCIYIYIY